MRNFFFYRKENKFPNNYGKNQNRFVLGVKDRKLFHIPFFSWTFFRKLFFFFKGIASYCTKCTKTSRKEVFMTVKTS